MGRRRKYTLYHQVVQEMLDLYYNKGMPISVICREFSIGYNTLDKLIKENESKIKENANNGFE